MIGKKVRVINEGSTLHGAIGTCVNRYENRDAWWVRLETIPMEFPMMFRSFELEEIE